MAIPPGMYRLVMSGSMPGGEIWSSGFWVHGDAPTDTATANALAQLWQAELHSEEDPAFMRLFLNGYCSEGVTWDTTTVYSYPDGGPHAAVIGVYEATVTGGQASAQLPNQVSLVFSLRTGGAGRRQRGRMFLPMNAVNLTTDGQISSGTATTLANSLAATFSDWNASGDNGEVVVCSQSATAFYKVTSIIVDTRLDIQRRRAASQSIDGRSTAPLTA